MSRSLNIAGTLPLVIAAIAVAIVFIVRSSPPETPTIQPPPAEHAALERALLKTAGLGDWPSPDSSAIDLVRLDVHYSYVGEVRIAVRFHGVQTPSTFFEEEQSRVRAGLDQSWVDDKHAPAWAKRRFTAQSGVPLYAGEARPVPNTGAWTAWQYDPTEKTLTVHTELHDEADVSRTVTAALTRANIIIDEMWTFAGNDFHRWYLLRVEREASISASLP